MQSVNDAAEVDLEVSAQPRQRDALQVMAIKDFCQQLVAEGRLGQHARRLGLQGAATAEAKLALQAIENFLHFDRINIDDRALAAAFAYQLAAAMWARRLKRHLTNAVGLLRGGGLASVPDMAKACATGFGLVFGFGVGFKNDL